jgi:hypothetical protein
MPRIPHDEVFLALVDRAADQQRVPTEHDVPRALRS